MEDLSPLIGLKLTYLNCIQTKVRDLSPLHDMPIRGVNIDDTQVRDLASLKGMNLISGLSFQRTKVADLSPLKGMPLTFLRCEEALVTDLSPLEKMPLKQLSCDFKPFRDTQILRSIKTLESINGKPAADFWKDVEAQQAVFDAWIKQVAGMPLEEQVKAVAKKLQELNPGFEGKVEHKVENGVVAELVLKTDDVSDISPARALASLKVLGCNGSVEGKSKLVDLSPLRGLKLTALHCFLTQVADLTPLKGMPLTHLRCHVTKVADLSPLQGMPLAILFCYGTPVHDLTPLKGMPLTELHCQQTSVADLSPLKGMPLRWTPFFGQKNAIP